MLVVIEGKTSFYRIYLRSARKNGSKINGWRRCNILFEIFIYLAQSIRRCQVNVFTVAYDLVNIIGNNSITSGKIFDVRRLSIFIIEYAESPDSSHINSIAKNIRPPAEV